ncbi:MAG TPA: acetamidase/formamidase family protein [Acidothermaceae bacterium]
MTNLRIESVHSHAFWDRSLEPVLRVAPGAEISLELRDASGGQITPDDGPDAIARLDLGRVNPCTGPIAVDGLEPGDGLVVTILDIEPAPWAWTANIPGFGLLADDFPDAHLWISHVEVGRIHTPIGVELETRPMVGTIGVAPVTYGRHPILVPAEHGGNMDICQLGIGTELHLPVLVPHALFSAGDSHALQGDGEICGTGAEMGSTLTVRLDRAPAPHRGTPWFEHEAPALGTRFAATTGIGPDLFEAARDASRRGVELVVTRTGLAPIDAYLLLSLIGDLRISEIVDAPNWVVSLHIPIRYL